MFTGIVKQTYTGAFPSNPSLAADMQRLFGVDQAPQAPPRPEEQNVRTTPPGFTPHHIQHQQHAPQPVRQPTQPIKAPTAEFGNNGISMVSFNNCSYC